MQSYPEGTKQVFLNHLNRNSGSLAPGDNKSEVRKLIDRFPELVNTQDANGSPCFHALCQRGDLDMVKVFLSKPTLAINAQDSYGRTGFWWALQTGLQYLFDPLLDDARLQPFITPYDISGTPMQSSLELLLNRQYSEPFLLKMLSHPNSSDQDIIQHLNTLLNYPWLIAQLHTSFQTMVTKSKDDEATHSSLVTYLIETIWMNGHELSIDQLIKVMDVLIPEPTMPNRALTITETLLLSHPSPLIVSMASSYANQTAETSHDLYSIKQWLANRRPHLFVDPSRTFSSLSTDSAEESIKLLANHSKSIERCLEQIRPPINKNDQIIIKDFLKTARDSADDSTPNLSVMQQYLELPNPLKLILDKALFYAQAYDQPISDAAQPLIQDLSNQVKNLLSAGVDFITNDPSQSVNATNIAAAALTTTNSSSAGLKQKQVILKQLTAVNKEARQILLFTDQTKQSTPQDDDNTLETPSDHTTPKP